MPTGKHHKKENIRKLNKLPNNVEADFYKNGLDSIDSAFDSNFQRKLISNLKRNEDVKNYLLASSKLGQHMQEDIDMYITKDRSNEASFRCKLNPMFKNLMRRQNGLELVFKDVSTFNPQNSMMGSLIKEIEIGKRDLASELVKKVPKPTDFDLQTKLADLQKF